MDFIGLIGLALAGSTIFFTFQQVGLDLRVLLDPITFLLVFWGGLGVALVRTPAPTVARALRVAGALLKSPPRSQIRTLERLTACSLQAVSRCAETAWAAWPRSGIGSGTRWCAGPWA